MYELFEKSASLQNLIQYYSHFYFQHQVILYLLPFGSAAHAARFFNYIMKAHFISCQVRAQHTNYNYL